MKKLVPIIAIAVVVFIIYQRSPGLRGKVAGMQGKMTNWSEENIREDPTGFLDMAEGKIKKSLKGLEGSKSTIESTMSDLTSKRDSNQAMVDTATRLSGEFKTAYKTAEVDGAWPVTVAADSYDRVQLIDQVETLMAQKNSLTALIVSQDGALAKAGEAQTKLKTQITKLKGELQQIATKRETVKIDAMTAESQKWLDAVNEQVAKSSDIANLGEDPVRDLEDFVKIEEAKTKKAAEDAAEAEKKQKTIDFLDS